MLGAVLALAGAADVAAQEPVRAGAAEADITAPVGTPMFAYTSRSRLTDPSNLDGALQLVADPDTNLYAKTFVPSEGFHTRVRARAIVLESGGDRYALVQADLGGLPYALVQDVLARIRHTGITGERLLLSATHTHASTGPIWPSDNLGYALLGGDLYDPRIFELTARGIARAIVIASERLAPARVGVATADARGASRNRSFEPFRRNPEAPPDEAEARAASVDPTVTVVRVDDADGRPLGVWSNFAIHPTSFGAGNPLFSGDTAGVAERIVAAAVTLDAAGRRRAPARPVVNVWTNAAEGDVSPNGAPAEHDGDPLRYVPNQFASTHVAGERVARGILEAWRAAGGRMSERLELGARRGFVAFDGTQAGGEPVGPFASLGAGGIVGPDGFCAPIEGLAGPGQGRKFPAIVGAGLVPASAPVSVWRVGGLVIASFPSEVTRQMGARILAALKDEGGLDRFALAGLTNGYVSYTATPEEYDACHYEGSFTLFGRRQGQRFLDFARGLTGALVHGRPAPESGPELPSAAIAASDSPGPRTTPAAGRPVEQPPAAVARYERAVFRWRGGDTAIDPPRGRALVTLERRDGSDWTPVATDDSFAGTTVRESGGVWRETHQFGVCDEPGTYRFHVIGRADRGAGPRPYELASEPFELRPIESIQVSQPAIGRRIARLRAIYPDPGEEALLALPKRVRTGSAALRVTPRRGPARRVRARLDRDALGYIARIPPGATIEVLRVRDACGNTGR